MLFEVIGEGRFTLGKYPKVDIVEDIRFSGHQVHATGCAQGSRVAVVEPHALGCEGVETRRREFLAPVGTETFIADIIRHDQDDIEFFAFCSGCRKPGKERDREKEVSEFM